MIEHRHLHYFIEAARLQHVTRAAANLHIAQPALSQNIRQLEGELGVALFLRQKKRLVLTDAGRAFLAEAVKTVEQFQHAKLVAQRAERGEMGKLAIGFGTTAGVTVLPEMIRRFRKLHPAPEVILRELFGDAQLTGLRSGELDAAIGYTSLSEEEFSSYALNSERLYAVVPEKHPLARLRTVSLGDLRAEEMILPKRDVAGVVMEAVLAACAAARFEPKLSHRVETPHISLALVSAGLGISIAPASACALHQEGVTARLIRDVTTKVSLRVFWRRDNHSPVLEHFLRCCAARIPRGRIIKV